MYTCTYTYRCGYGYGQRYVDIGTSIHMLGQVPWTGSSNRRCSDSEATNPQKYQERRGRGALQTFQQSRGAGFSMHWSRQTFQQSRAERGAGGGGAESGMGGMDGRGSGGFNRHRSHHTVQQSRAERRGGGGGLGMHWSLQTFPQPRGEGGNENAEIGEPSGRAESSGRRAVRAARRLGMGNTMGLH